MPSIFLIGGSGYVGGSLLVKIRENYPEWPVTALVRKKQQVEAIGATGATVIQPTTTKGQYDVIREETYKADMTINAADCDDLELCEAILSAMKKKTDDGNPKGIFLHTSGAMLYNDSSAQGKQVDGKYWDDNDEADIKGIDPKAIHGPFDTRVLKAGEEGYVTNYTICPTALVGEALGPIRGPSVFVKMLVASIMPFQRATIVEEGSNRYNYVHLHDLLDLYMRLLKVIVSGKEADASSYTRFYIGDSTEITYRIMAEVYGLVLARLGVIPGADVDSISINEARPDMRTLAADMRVRGNRARALGWNPRTVDLRDTVEEDVKAALAVLRPA